MYPINTETDVKELVNILIKKVNDKFKFRIFIDINKVKINFALIGCCAGICTTNKIEKTISLNFNKVLMSENPSTYFNTVIHEVAHGVINIMYNKKCGEHGKQWKSVVVMLGGTPERYHQYSTDTIKKPTPLFIYTCSCRYYYATAQVHNKITKGKNRYCTSCKEFLSFVETTAKMLHKKGVDSG